MKRYYLILAICFYLSSCHSQLDIKNIDNWKSYPIPTNLDTLSKYSYSHHEWTVSIRNRGVRVIQPLPYDDHSTLPFDVGSNGDSKTKITFISVDDGYLIGFNRGEWGGHLDWYSKNGKLHYTIADEEIAQFIKKNGKVYAIQGLAHLIISEGSIINIEEKKGKWVAKQYVKLPQAPFCFGLDSKNNFIILTSDNLLKVDTNKNIKTLVRSGIWSQGLYPNSLVMVNDIVYAGMRAGVYKYNLETGKQEWLLPY